MLRSVCEPGHGGDSVSCCLRNCHQSVELRGFMETLCLIIKFCVPVQVCEMFFQVILSF